VFLLFFVAAEAFALVSEKIKFTSQNKSFGLWDFGKFGCSNAQRPLFVPLAGMHQTLRKNN
jgi:hypothetical protein